MGRLCKRKVRLPLPPAVQMFGMCMAEFIGTTLLIFFGCMGLINFIEHDLFYDSMGYGLEMMFLITIFGHLSGGHFSPVVTLWAVIYGTLPLLMVPLYFICQIVGALLGYGLLMGILPDNYFYTGVCVTRIGDETSLTQAFWLEFLATAILIFVYCGVWDHRTASNKSSSPLKIGFAYMQLMNCTIPFTGCGMNPARSFAAAVYSNMWDNHWIYWAGPITGSIVGTVFYMLFVAKPIPERTIRREKIFTYTS